MSHDEESAGGAIGPWRPGIESQVPEPLRPLCTYLRADCVFTSVEAARELRDFSGLEMADIVAFRPERLALHELLIRVTADLSVPDGSKIEDLGINFRGITRTIFGAAIAPRMATIAAAYDTLRRDAAALIEREASTLFEAPRSAPAVERRRGLGFFAWRARRDDRASISGEGGSAEARAAARWDSMAHAATDPLEAAAYRALSRVLSALLVRHGRLWGDRATIASLATDIACNHVASDEIGRLIEPWIAQAVSSEGIRRLPAQDHPIVMNTKGASASGKSTLRPLQKQLAREIGVDWAEFALISPDIWRKQLLDYGSLGPHYKYAGAFTGDELKIVDEKLDRYMARKAARGETPHLLIDRFRFDSFAPDSDQAGSNLLTRFGQILYLFFMITSPASLVERAWNRGLDVGRYKAVDDTLAHGVEAYSGMPELFFTWVRRVDKRVHFEFLDNSVVLPQRPRTVAFGWNDTMNVLDVGCLLDVERYRRVDINATAPQSLYPDRAALAPERNVAFLRQCIAHFREIAFAEQASGRLYLRVVDGIPVWADRDALERALADPDTRAGISATLPVALGPSLAAAQTPLFLRTMPRDERIRTLGDWGAEGPADSAAAVSPSRRVPA